MSTDQQPQPAPQPCQEVTWKGKPCTARARFIITRSTHHVCKRHLNAFPPGIEYREIDK